MKKLLLLAAFLLATTACTSSPTPEPVVEGPVVENPVAEEPFTKEPPVEAEPTLTEDLLVSGEWGPEESIGSYIEFHEDGTYLDWFAGEGDGPQEGTYEIKDEGVTLIRNEGESWNLSLGESEDNLYYTVYLVGQGSTLYWDKTKPVPPGSERTLNGYSVIVVESNAELTPEGAPKAAPQVGASVYEFRFCGMSCETGEVESFAQSFTGVLARTENKEAMNGAEDYWYLVGVELGWYTAALIDEEYIGKISYAWVHGSELQ